MASSIKSFLASKPLKSYPKEFPMSALCGEGTKQKQSKDDHLQKDVEDFLFKLLGEVFQLNRDVIREVPVVVDMICKRGNKVSKELADSMADSMPVQL
ncbi:hypothetical protein CICLE_v10027151mg [Citrus x clementina]|uniref:Uncharacterized protein n=1 Tax=Citrus clementina TaxID=85681 RepID=V4SNW9_CITCL|nr:hypothetical protein CICLE_v10027151mg [Citrus x clementina]